MVSGKRVINGTVGEWRPVLREMLADYGHFAATLLVDRENADQPAAEHPITALELDDDGAELNLCAEPHSQAPLTVSTLLAQLDGLPAKCAAYHVYSAAPWRAIGRGAEVRAHAPIVNMVVDEEGERFGFVGEGARLAKRGRGR